MMVLGKVTEDTIRLTPGGAEARHVTDSMRQRALLLRALVKLRSSRSMQRPIALYLSKCNCIVKTDSLAEHLRRVLDRREDLNVESVKSYVESL